VLITVVVCLQEWIENPGGIFRDERGTRWHFVRDTAVSWFVPTVSVTAPLGLGAALVRSLLRRPARRPG